MSERTRIVCFGEMLVRLSSSDGEQLLQSPSLQVHFGGAEANVAVSLARLGHAAAMISIVPPNALGAPAIAELRRHGVDTSGILTGPGRMGLYFLTPGAVLRPSAVLYDRAGSAFALAAPTAIDWRAALRDARWLHLSGIASALGANAAAANQRAADAALELGVAVSFDGNYREQLWTASGGDAKRLLHGMLATARLAFVDDRDIALTLGIELRGEPLERRRGAAAAAFAAFPRLETICSTIREVDSAQRQRLGGVLFTRERELMSRTYALDGIVDRVGAGDAFAAGILHGRVAGLGAQETLELAVAAASLKHSIRGDFNLVSLSDVEQLVAAKGLDIRR
ncbi:MAG TPA: sugar kinase [Gammaproteobacteria bacterium]|nr:sugar kinase [Gammaproteobacteria bacterium]